MKNDNDINIATIEIKSNDNDLKRMGILMIIIMILLADITKDDDI